jgi:hypothetical protein
MVSRREKSRTDENKSPTIRTQKDKRKLIVVSYLISLGEKRANRNIISNKAFKLRKQEPGDFKQLMNELVAMKWIDSETREDGIEWYRHTENGRDALNEAKKIARENHPLAALEIFEDILEI